MARGGCVLANWVFWVWVLGSTYRLIVCLGKISIDGKLHRKVLVLTDLLKLKDG